MRLRFGLKTMLLIVYSSGVILSLVLTAFSRPLEDDLDQPVTPRSGYSGYIELMPVFRPHYPAAGSDGV
jgi:hypothetical protein